MNVRYNPNTAYHHHGHHSHAVEVPSGSRLLFISGQVGVRPDGTCPEGIEDQCVCVWDNIRAVLEAAGMGLGDMVKIGIFLTREEDRDAANKVRRRVLGDNPPSSTGVTITSLADPKWLIEIDVVAAKA